MSTLEELDEIFREGVIQVIRRFSPEKKNIVVPEACIQELKQCVRENILRAPRAFLERALTHELRLPSSSTAAQERRDSNDSVEDEESRMSCDASSEGGRSHDEEASRSSAIEKIHKSSSSNSLPEFKGNRQKMSRAKRLQELRAHRRKTAEHDKFSVIESPNERELPTYFFDWYTEEIEKGGEVSYVYHKIVNSTRHFFERVTFPINVTKMLSEFLREHAVISYARLNGFYENTRRRHLSVEQRVLEMQIQVLLDLYIITIELETKPLYAETRERDSPIELGDILKKLRFIYIATDAATMKNFLEEQVSDNFNHIIPQEIAKIFDKLCISLPADLEEHNPNPNPWAADDYNPCSRRLRARDETNSQLMAMLEENAPSSESQLLAKENDKKRKERAEKERLEKVRKEEATQEQVTPAKRRDKKREVIPETPDEKLQPKEEEQFAEVVKQTPLGKLRQAGSRRGSKRLSELVKLSEERIRPSRAAALASEKANKAIMSATVAPNTSKETLFALHTPSPRPQRTARANLIERFNSTGSTPTTQSSGTKRARKHIEVVVEDEEPRKKRTRSSNSVTSPAHSPGSKQVPGLGKEQLLQYKKRMCEISKQKCPTGQTGSQTRARTSLFDDDEVVLEKPKVDQRSIQKNRTGREVRAGTTVHLAHILLNVHNPAPLQAFNAAKMKNSTVPRLQRLVRIAKKKQKIRLIRLRKRVRQSIAATTVTID